MQIENKDDQTCLLKIENDPSNNTPIFDSCAINVTLISNRNSSPPRNPAVLPKHSRIKENSDISCSSSNPDILSSILLRRLIIKIAFDKESAPPSRKNHTHINPKAAGAAPHGAVVVGNARNPV